MDRERTKLDRMCPACGRLMRLARSIPSTGELPELETYECEECRVEITAAKQDERHHMKRCYQCNGRFGLIRYRLAHKNFCSKQCRDKYRTDTEHKVSRIRKWTEFLAEKL